MNFFLLVPFFLALQLMPAEVTEFTISARGKTVEWKQTGDGRWRCDSTDDFQPLFYSVKGNAIILQEVKNPEREISVLMDRYIDVPETPSSGYWAGKKEFGVTEGYGAFPIKVQHDPAKKIIILTQEDGAFSGGPTVITYKTK